MFIVKRKHLLIFTIFFLLLQNCQLKEPTKTHGINYLQNKYKILEVDKTNSNDVLNILGTPHTKSLKNDNTWIYFERTLTRGEMHKFGKNVLKSNNVLEIKFNNVGIIKSKKIYNKDNMVKVKYSDLETQNSVTKKSFINGFLQSVREKMYGKNKF